MCLQNGIAAKLPVLTPPAYQVEDECGLVVLLGAAG